VWLEQLVLQVQLVLLVLVWEQLVLQVQLVLVWEQLVLVWVLVW
jgi:hypothetical protein